MKKYCNRIISVTGGIMVGFVNGFFGGGGGMLCVPLLEYALLERTKVSHATAILVILPITIVSAITYIYGGYYDIMATLYIGIGVMVGGVIGSLLLVRLPQNIIAYTFAIIMIIAGLKMLVL